MTCTTENFAPPPREPWSPQERTKQNKNRTDLGILVSGVPCCFKITTLKKAPGAQAGWGAKVGGASAEYARPPRARFVSNHTQPANKIGDNVNVRLRVGDDAKLARNIVTVRIVGMIRGKKERYLVHIISSAQCFSRRSSVPFCFWSLCCCTCHCQVSQMMFYILLMGLAHSPARPGPNRALPSSSSCCSTKRAATG